jgi:hypothetical protein
MLSNSYSLKLVYYIFCSNFENSKNSLSVKSSALNVTGSFSCSDFKILFSWESLSFIFILFYYKYHVQKNSSQKFGQFLKALSLYWHIILNQRKINVAGNTLYYIKSSILVNQGEGRDLSVCIGRQYVYFHTL